MLSNVVNMINQNTSALGQANIENKSKEITNETNEQLKDILDGITNNGNKTIPIESSPRSHK